MLKFTAASGTYNLAGADITGTVTLVNTGGGLITVSLAPGVSYINTGPNITVEQVVGATLTITNLEIGSDIVILQAGTSNVITSVDQVGSTTWAYIYTNLINIDIGVFKPGFKVKYIRNYALTTSDSYLPMTQEFDRSYT